MGSLKFTKRSVDEQKLKRWMERGYSPQQIAATVCSPDRDIKKFSVNEAMKVLILHKRKLDNNLLEDKKILLGKIKEMNLLDQIGLIKEIHCNNCKQNQKHVFDIDLETDPETKRKVMHYFWKCNTCASRVTEERRGL